MARKTITIRLEKGLNTIRLSNPTSWMPDIDYIDVVCTAPDRVDTPAAATSASLGRSYDLQGRPVTTDTKGIVITNGKKVMR